MSETKMARVWINGGWAIMGAAGYDGQVIQGPEGKGATKLGRRQAVESDPDGSYVAGQTVYAIEWER